MSTSLSSSCKSPRSSWISILCIMVQNSLKSISPLPSSSTSWTTLSQTSSSNAYWLEQSLSLTSSGDIVPPLSWSNKLNAYCNVSFVNNLFLLIVATTHSPQSIYPEWSRSTLRKIFSTSSWAYSSPYNRLYPSSSSALLNWPSLFMSRTLKAFCKSLFSSTFASWFTMKIITASYSFC